MERAVSKRRQQEEREQTKRANANRAKLTKAGIDRLECPSEGQVVVWDKEQKGLSVLLSQSVKSYRATYRLRSRTITTVIGRVGEMDLDEARDTCGQYRRDARRGIDPKGPKPGTLTYSDVVDRYIEIYAKPNQRTWDQTEDSLKSLTKLLKRPFDLITKKEVMDILDDWAVKDKHPYKATNALSRVKHMWGWAVDKGIVETSILREVKNQYERRNRNRVFSDDEIKNIWQACDKTADPVEGAYFKLILLIAPRVSALAWMRRSHLTRFIDDPQSDDFALWVTPHELTKTKKRQRDPDEERTYQTPLPALAIRILKGLPKPKPGDNDPLMFPGLPIDRTKAGGYTINTARIVERLKKAGAPNDFFPHACRHTIASWLKKKGHSKWERSLILNHAEGSVTGDYSHGFADELKLKLLEKWAAHVEALVSPQGVALLR